MYEAEYYTADGQPHKIILSSSHYDDDMYETFGLDGGLFHQEQGETPEELNLRMLREVGSALTYLGDENARMLQDPVYTGICQPVLDIMTAKEAREFQDKITNWDQDELDELKKNSLEIFGWTARCERKFV